MLIALLVCLIPTTIGALLSAIGIAGMDRLVQRNVLAMSGRAVEAAGDIDTLLLDKTGTITFGNRQATELLPATGVDAAELAAAARLSSLADQTPEGRSDRRALRGRARPAGRGHARQAVAEFVPFTAQTRMSRRRHADGREIRKGAGRRDRCLGRAGRHVRREIARRRRPRSPRSGGTPLVVAVREHGRARVLGVIHLQGRRQGRACASGSPSCGRWASARS